ncbi:unnamed protein product [Clonostachys rosea f. rosea IK726]|uniref:Uncharacterized protein n=1 Tax=Clonostachys rosea f. rosea IK726 TaxID=1349383 RepID=A0ACA9U6T4_BIOOC|nr:unnamed protein product [Clonostachys rosea f. rosea IK726]
MGLSLPSQIDTLRLILNYNSHVQNYHVFSHTLRQNGISARRAFSVFCLIVIPFAYFWHEEYDEIEFEEEGRTWTSRLFSAAKYILIFVALVVVLFLLGFFVPPAGNNSQAHWDLDYFKKLISQQHGEKALTFVLGLLIILSATTASQLEMNGERRRQIEMRNAGRHDEMPRKDRRELDALVREEQTLVRRERLAAEAQGEGRSILYRFWFKLCALFRPVKMLGGLLLLVLAVLIWASMLITGIDKAKNSICKQRCGYILGQTHIFQPLNWIFLQSAKVFPVDYILMALLILFLFGSSITGVATVGIRFLWVRICQIRRGRTAPQALLMATVMLTLLVLAINYAVAMLVVPQYATYGTQTFCSNKLAMPGLQPNCTGHEDMIIPCSEALKDSHAKDVCTPSMMSTFLNRITITWPFFGMVDFWTQFAFLLLFLIVLVTAVIRTTKVNMSEIDEDAEADEEESLLATTRRRFSATWEDLRGKMATKPSQGGTEGGSSSNPV